MSEYIEVKIDKDESSHSYVFPATMAEEFHCLSEAMYMQGEHSDGWYDATEAFSQVFEVYRQEPQNVKLFMRKEDIENES